MDNASKELGFGHYWIKHNGEWNVARRDTLGYSKTDNDWVWWRVQSGDYILDDQVTEVGPEIPTHTQFLELRECLIEALRVSGIHGDVDIDKQIERCLGIVQGDCSTTK